MDHVATSIVPPAKMMMGLADLLLDGITPDRFARKPDGIDTNSPAFVYGHLTLYPARVLKMAGLEPSGAAAPYWFDEIFAPGALCQDDPFGEIYPEKEQLIVQFRVSFRQAAE